MRPDDHKAKESRKYQQKKKKQGDTEAADVAEERRKAAKARDRGVGIGAILRRNGQERQETDEEREERIARQAKFSKRKMETNADRYFEETEEDALTRDAEMGIDRETTDLVSMLEEKEEGSSSFFKFKEEQLYSTDNQDIINRNIMQLDFGIFETSLKDVDPTLLLGLEDEVDLVDNALKQHPAVLDKPIVPSFSKNAKGYVLFKSQQPATPNVVSEANGIYLRNDGSNHRPITTTTPKKEEVPLDDLDEILALESNKETTPVKKSLPRPGSIPKKSIVTAPSKPEDDEAWLDDLLGQ